MLVTLVAGCSHSSPPRACPLPGALASAEQVRIMVQFRQATPGDSPAVLEQLQVYAKACVSHIASVSPTLHVYAVAGGGDALVLRESLKQWSAVQDVVADNKVKPSQLR